MDIDDLWLRDGDERFAAFLRRLGFDHNEAKNLAEKTRPPWGIWDRCVPRRLLPKNDVRRECPICRRRTSAAPPWSRFGGTCTPQCEAAYREVSNQPAPPLSDAQVIDGDCICLNVTGHSIYCPANPNGRMPYPSADPANNIPIPVAGYLRETAEPLPLPPYDGKPMILEDEREVTEMHEPGYRA